MNKYLFVYINFKKRKFPLFSEHTSKFNNSDERRFKYGKNELKKKNIIVRAFVHYFSNYQ